jgi:hypothetical protein
MLAANVGGEWRSSLRDKSLFVDGITEIAEAPMRVLRENVTFRSCLFLSYQENQLMQSQTCSMDKVTLY